MKSLKKSVILLGLISFVSFSSADLPKEFDYKKASTNYVYNTAGSFSSLANPYFFGGFIGASEGSSYCSGASN